jgi:hypothetical protein
MMHLKSRNLIEETAERIEEEAEWALRASGFSCRECIVQEETEEEEDGDFFSEEP